MKRTAICLVSIFLFAGFVQAQKAKTMTGVIIDNMLSNKWTAIVIKVGDKKYGIQTSRALSAGDIRSGVKGWDIKSVGNTWDKGRRVRVFYTKVDSSFKNDEVNLWLNATKIVEIK